MNVERNAATRQRFGHRQLDGNQPQIHAVDGLQKRYPKVRARQHDRKRGRFPVEVRCDLPDTTSSSLGRQMYKTAASTIKTKQANDKRRRQHHHASQPRVVGKGPRRGSSSAFCERPKTQGFCAMFTVLFLCRASGLDCSTLFRLLFAFVFAVDADPAWLSRTSRIVTSDPARSGPPSDAWPKDPHRLASATSSRTLPQLPGGAGISTSAVELTIFSTSVPLSRVTLSLHRRPRRKRRRHFHQKAPTSTDRLRELWRRCAKQPGQATERQRYVQTRTDISHKSAVGTPDAMPSPSCAFTRRGADRARRRPSPRPWLSLPRGVAPSPCARRRPAAGIQMTAVRLARLRRVRLALVVSVGLIVMLAAAEKRHQHEQPPATAANTYRYSIAAIVGSDLHPVKPHAAPKSPANESTPPHGPQTSLPQCAKHAVMWRQGRNILSTMIERIYLDNIRTFVNFEWKPAKLAPSWKAKRVRARQLFGNTCGRFAGLSVDSTAREAFPAPA